MKARTARQLSVALVLVAACSGAGAAEAWNQQDVYGLEMLTPRYYRVGAGDPFRQEVYRFVARVSEMALRHPLKRDDGHIPDYSVPTIGELGAGKGPGGTAEHHTGIDLHVGGGETDVEIHAAHDGIVTVMRDAPKYRHYVAVSKDVVDDGGQPLGKLVTLYAHVDLDLDAADGLLVDGLHVVAGDLISRHLYAGTVGGPHLHFEIRYYRPGDAGDETYYSGLGPGWNAALTDPSADPWAYGYWNPDVGYGFGNPLLHGVGLTAADVSVPSVSPFGIAILVTLLAGIALAYRRRPYEGT